MSILDTFFVMFEGNSDGAKKGAAEAVQAGEKAAAQIDKTLEHSKLAAQQIGKENTAVAATFDMIGARSNAATAHIVGNAKKIVAGFAGMFAVEKIFDGIFSQAKQSASLAGGGGQYGSNADPFGMSETLELKTSIEQLDIWQRAIQRVGGSVHEFDSAMLSVNDKLERLALTGSGRLKPILENLGIEIKKGETAFQLLPKLAEKMKGMSRSESGSIGRLIGFDAATIKLLQAGPEALEKIMQKERSFGVITEESAQRAKKFRIEWLTLEADLREVFRAITIASDDVLLPVLTALIEPIREFVDFVAQHRNLVTGAFIAMGAAAIIAGGAFGVFGSIVAVVFSPITLITAAIAALIAVFAFLYDDIQEFAAGNNSVIGELAKRWPIVGEVIGDIIEVVKALWDTVVTAVSDMVAWISKIPDGMRQWSEIFSGVIDFIKEAFESLPEPIRAVFDEIGSMFKGVFEIGGEVAKLMPESWKVAWDIIKEDAKIAFEVMKAIFNLIADLVVNPEHAFQNFAARMQKIFAGLGADFSKLGDEIAHFFQSIIDAFAKVQKIFDTLWGKIGGLADKVGGILGAGKRWVGNAANMVLHPDDWIAGKQALDATNSPLMAHTTASLAAAGQTTVNRDTSVSIGAITIQTQATDAAGISSALDQELRRHYSETMPHFADGVSH